MKSLFVVASEAEIARIKTLDDAWRHIERMEPMLGGNISLEAIASLSQVVLSGKTREPSPTQYSWADGSRFYSIDAELCEKMASAEHEYLLNASVFWSEDEVWRDTGVNRMDLAGVILDIAALCKHAEPGRSLFILLSNED